MPPVFLVVAEQWKSHLGGNFLKLNIHLKNLNDLLYPMVNMKPLARIFWQLYLYITSISSWWLLLTFRSLTYEP